MKSNEYTFICEHIANISRIPVRLYQGNQQMIYINPTLFPKDPCEPFLDDLLTIQKKVSYFITPFYHYYGIVHFHEHSLILGPTYQFAPTRIQIRDYMFSLGIHENYQEQYRILQTSITPMSLEIFVHLLCLIYYFFTREQISVTDLLIYDSASQITAQEKAASSAPATEDISQFIFTANHDTFAFEKEMMAYVSSGNLEALNNLFANAPAGQAGKMASNFLRQTKDLFITTVTLTSRAAIEGGLAPEEALSLSDSYIQHCEKFDNLEQIMNLQYHMVLDFTAQVNDLNHGKPYNQFMRSVTSYVHDHISEELSVEQMSKDLYMSRGYLSTKFKQECGTTLTAYIQKQKIKKAKEYLKSSNCSLLEISTYLGFSSQGYFQNTFKKMTGMTPSQYRKQ